MDPASEGSTEGKKPVMGGDFSQEKFEQAQFQDARVRDLQAKKSELRRSAIQKLEQLLAQNPYYENKADVYFRLAEAYWEENKFQYLIQREDFERQLEAFENKTLATKPVEPEEDYAVSLDYYRKILQQFPDYNRIDEVIYYLGRGALQAGKDREDRELTKEGVSHFQKLVQNYPNSRFIAESHLALAEHYFENNSLYYAKTNYEKIINNFKDSGMYNYALYKLGWVYFNLAEFKKSIQTFQNVVEIVKNANQQGMIEFKEQALNDLVVIYAEIPDGWREARSYFTKEIGEEKAYDKLRKLAELYVGQDKDEDAVALYSHFLEHDPNDFRAPDYYDNIIAVLKKLNDATRIEAEIREMIAYFDPRNTWYSANKSNPEAIKAAMTLAENNLLFLATDYHKRAQKDGKVELYQQAAKDYAQFVDTFPSSENAYIANFYYAEILYEQMRDYENAIKQYQAVVDRDKKGDFAEDALLGIVYSYGELAKKAKIEGFLDEGGKSKIKLVKLSEEDMKKREASIERTELHEVEKGYVEAADQYVTLTLDLLKDPEVRKKNPERGEKIPEIMYLAARVFYNHGQFKNAITRLETIFQYDDTHEFAAYAVNLMLDSYVKLRYWNEIEQWASRLIAAKNFKLKSKKELDKIRAIAKAELARDLTLEKNFDAAIKENEDVYKEFKAQSPDLASKALYNVAVIHENAKRLPEAIATYNRVIKEFPKEEIAPQALFTIGVIYESQTQFDKAAGSFEQMKQFEKYEDTPDAIKNAGLIREAMGDYDGAIQSYETYLKTFKDRPDAVAVELHIGRVFEMKNNADGWKRAADHYGKFIKKYGKGGHGEEIVEALTRMGHSLQATDKVKNRKAASQAFADALKAFNTLATSGKDLSKSPAKNFAAEAAFQLAEYVYDDFHAASIDTSSIAKLKKSLTTKAELLAKCEGLMLSVLEYKSGGWTAGALFRNGLLYYEFSQALFSVPVPEGLSPDQEEEYQFTLEETAAPLEEKSLTAFQFALQLAQELGVYNEWSKLSAEFAAKVNPESFPVSSEPVAKADHEMDTLLSANFIRSLRRGDVEVQVIEIKETGAQQPGEGLN
ncbi:MAG: hypothetical protein AMXMBFR64_51980 [Myxococcales bacterium]